MCIASYWLTCSYRVIRLSNTQHPIPSPYSSIAKLLRSLARSDEDATPQENAGPL